MNGITYFRLVSQYDNDITKNCGLTGNEIDNNFYVLEGRDVKSVTLDGETLKVNLYNGEVLSADMSGLVEGIEDSMTDYVKSLSFDFDRDNGVLTITQDGVTQTIAGFVTSYEGNNVVATDETLVGTGKPTSPLGISPAYKTGSFAPVGQIIDKEAGDEIPSGENLHAGDRILVHDKVSDFGLLYNYEGVKRISCDLYLSSSQWRIPTKEDWDDMLNAIEPNAADKNHSNTVSNRYLGKYAGGYLKSKTGWIGTSEEPSPGENAGSDATVDDMLGNTSAHHCCCGRNVPACSPMYCGEYSSCCCRPQDITADGTDMYGFNAKPAGYIDDGNLYGYFGERAAFWTATLSPSGNSAYIKRLEWDKTNVFQDIISTNYSLSLRLVKDFDGSNYFGREQILGESYDTVLMPSVTNGSRVWTAVNVAFGNDSYCGKQPNGEITYTDKYYIAEWNGVAWVTCPFGEGDKVVVLNAPDGSKNVEYTLINGELVKTADIIAGQVLDSLQDELGLITDSIAAETQARIEADEAINARIDQEVQARIDGDEALSGIIDAEIAARQEADQALSDRIDAQEIALSEAADRIHTAGTFDDETGVLKLTCPDEENIILVQFGFNFGDV